MLKRIAFLFIFLSFSTFQFAQKIKKQKSEDIPVEILMEDGRVLTGKMSELYFPDSDSFAGMVAQSNTKYSMYSDDVKFEFTNEITSQKESISFNDLKKIKVIDEFKDEIIGYEKLTIRQFDKDMNIIKKKYNAFLPILYEGKINLYGYDVMTCVGNNICTYSTTMLYIKNQSDEISYMPIDYDRIYQLAYGSISKRFIASYKEVGKDCENFQKYMSRVEKQIEENGYVKTVFGNWNTDMKNFREQAKKQGLKGSEFKKAKQKMQHNLFLKSYIGLIKEYEKNCK